MPSQKRVRADREALPPVSGQDTSRRREEGPIRRGEEDSPAASAEDVELVVEHEGLEIQLIEAAADEQAEQPAQKLVPDGPQHLGSLMPGRPACERSGRSGRSSFFTPHLVTGPIRGFCALQRLLQKPEATLHVVGWQDVTHDIVCVWASNGGLCNSLFRPGPGSQSSSRHVQSSA